MTDKPKTQSKKPVERESRQPDPKLIKDIERAYEPGEKEDLDLRLGNKRFRRNDR